jgi:chemotaxis protein MotB
MAKLFRDNVFARVAHVLLLKQRQPLLAWKEVECHLGGNWHRFLLRDTDNVPVGKPVTNFANFVLYDDNYTLSAARAREARRLLIGKHSKCQRKKCDCCWLWRFAFNSRVFAG